MVHIYPSYYKDFHCIGSRCRHNCCVGWEIDIDSDTYLKYKKTDGEMGERLESGIVHGDEPHFKCRDNGRCVFLNESNLCDIITELGEEHLCTICAEHPRFTNELPDRYEHGLGLCCEEAARIILTREERVTFTEASTDDEVIMLRDRVIEILQSRQDDIDTRCESALAECGIVLPKRSASEWAEYFLSLERLDDRWGAILEAVKDTDESSRGTSDVPPHIWENLLVYFVYRHMANAADTEDSAYRLAFAVLSYRMIAAASAVTGEDAVDLCRLYSAEIEYSTDNTEAVLDELYFFCEQL